MSATPSQEPHGNEAQTAEHVGPRAVAAASIGNALEWYDFSVYAFFAAYIAHNFFETGDERAALLSTFMVFAAGFIARPLGAVALGAIGDKKGRKAALMLAIGTMGLGILIIVATPPMAVIGLGAPILLVIARLLQGFSAGGEIGGAASFLVEHAPPGKAGTYAAWLQASMAIANIMSSVMGVIITTLFAEDQLLDWAWRIPFIFGLLIIPVGIYIRKALPETESFQQLVTDEEHDRGTWLRPLKTLFRDHPLGLLAAFALSVLWTTAIYAFVIYAPTYYRSTDIGMTFTPTEAFLASTAGNIVLLIGCLLSGRLSDRIGLKPLLVGSSILLVVVPWALLSLVHSTQNFGVLILVHIVLCALVSVISAISPVIIARIFPTEVRTSGVAISYNIAAIFFAGFTPALMTWATASISPIAPALWVAFGALICLAAAPLISSQMTHSEHVAGI